MESGNQEGLVIAAQLLGRVHLVGGQFEPAIRYAREAISYNRTVRSPSREALARALLAEALGSSGDSTAARDEMQVAARLAEQSGDSLVIDQIEESARNLGDKDGDLDGKSA